MRQFFAGCEEEESTNQPNNLDIDLNQTDQTISLEECDKGILLVETSIIHKYLVYYKKCNLKIYFKNFVLEKIVINRETLDGLFKECIRLTDCRDDFDSLVDLYSMLTRTVNSYSTVYHRMDMLKVNLILLINFNFLNSKSTALNMEMIKMIVCILRVNFPRLYRVFFPP